MLAVRSITFWLDYDAIFRLLRGPGTAGGSVKCDMGSICPQGV